MSVGLTRTRPRYNIRLMDTQERMYTDHVGTFEDGSQILVTRWADGSVTIATRPDKWSTWSKPVKTEDMTWTG